MGHSWSAIYFQEKFISEGIDADFAPYALDHVALQPQLDGYNVTIPYKEQIIPLLEGLDPIAQEIGAVNVVKTFPKTIGYNTDWLGFITSIRNLIRPTDKHALILGTGGAAKAVHYGLKVLGIHSQFVSRTARSGLLTYEDINREIIEANTIIVNATPVGMFPHVNECPKIPYVYLTERHLLFDCIYNPPLTKFLSQGEAHGCRTMNGLEMLHLQADAAWKIWNSNIE